MLKDLFIYHSFPESVKGKEEKLVTWEREKRIRMPNGKTYVYRYRITEECLGLVKIEEKP